MSRKLTTAEFIERTRNVHGDKYDYSKTEYVNTDTKVCIICSKHGEFWQSPSNHLMGAGCPNCWENKRGKSRQHNTSWFIEEARKVHNNKYDYSKANYIKMKDKICIICPKHGEFWQTPNSHLQGQGCPYCKESILEKRTEIEIIKRDLTYHKQKRFNWLKRQSLDFYLLKYNIGIECQGIQHFKSINYFGGQEKLEYTQQMDVKKKQLCEENGIKLYYINYNDDIETKLNEIIKENAIYKIT